MMRTATFYILLIMNGLLASCGSKKTETNTLSPEEAKAQEIVDKAIAAHGGEAYKTATFSFTFRDKDYSLTNYDDHYVYTRTFDDSTGHVEDILVNSSQLTRKINGDTVSLTDEWRGKYANSVNSVLYFIQLPYGLNASAVNKKLLGEVTIKGKEYYKVEVTFDQQGGGKDFDDVFVYWFGKSDSMMDYLAYYYHTDGGGIRFREAYNRQKIGGITFQDYVNYEPTDSTATVYQTDELFEKGQLHELSRIENVNIQMD